MTTDENTVSKESKESMGSADKIVAEFKPIRDTKRARLFEEQLGDQQWSDQDVAVGPLYVKLQALELIGANKAGQKIRVTIEPVE